MNIVQVFLYICYVLIASSKITCLYNASLISVAFISESLAGFCYERVTEHKICVIEWQITRGGMRNKEKSSLAGVLEAVAFFSHPSNVP